MSLICVMYCTAVTLSGALGFVSIRSPVLFVGEFLALNQSPGIFLKNVLCAAVFLLPLSSLLLLSVTEDELINCIIC